MKPLGQALNTGNRLPSVPPTCTPLMQNALLKFARTFARSILPAHSGGCFLLRRPEPARAPVTPPARGRPSASLA